MSDSISSMGLKSRRAKTQQLTLKLLETINNLQENIWIKTLLKVIYGFQVIVIQIPLLIDRSLTE